MAGYVFGPVPSRRLGRSLGVDLVPLKTCVFNCIYCQLGRSAATTVRRSREYAPAAEVLRQVRDKLETGAAPDYITLSGGGEPTLHAGIGDIITAIKDMTHVPVAVLTNGALFQDPEVRADCGRADVVMPSLDAGDEDTFQRVNRPHPGITLEGLVSGLQQFRREYEGEIWLEVFLIAGVNDSEQQCRKIRAHIDPIHPDRVDLNTAVRPTTEAGLRAVPPDRMAGLRPLFGPAAAVVADYSKLSPEAKGALKSDAVLEMLERRPCTLDDIAAGLGAPQAEVSKTLGALNAAAKIERVERDGKAYYRRKEET